MAVNQPMVDADVYSASVGVYDGHLWCVLDGDDMVDRFELSDLDAVVACLENEAVRRIATVVCTFSVEPPARIPTDESGVAVCLPTGDWVPYMGPESLQHRDIGVIQHPSLPISVPVDDSPPPPDFEWFSETTPAPEGAYSDFVDDAGPEPEPAPPAPEVEPVVVDVAAQPDDFLTGLGFDDAEDDLVESQEDIERWASGVLGRRAFPTRCCAPGVLAVRVLSLAVCGLRWQRSSLSRSVLSLSWCGLDRHRQPIQPQTSGSSPRSRPPRCQALRLHRQGPTNRCGR